MKFYRKSFPGTPINTSAGSIVFERINGQEQCYWATDKANVIRALDAAVAKETHSIQPCTEQEYQQFQLKKNNGQPWSLPPSADRVEARNFSSQSQDRNPGVQSARANLNDHLGDPPPEPNKPYVKPELERPAVTAQALPPQIKLAKRK